MLNFGFLHNEVVRFILQKFPSYLFLVLAHKVIEMKNGSEEVNVSYADPENQSCLYRFYYIVFDSILILF
jgi:hypothetical protein